MHRYQAQSKTSLFMNTKPSLPHPTRRRFLQDSTATVAAGAVVSQLAFPSVTFGADLAKKFKLGLIGCGGRGTGAASQALTADSNTEMWALADAFPEQIAATSKILEAQHKDRGAVPAGRRFTGINAYQQLLDSGVDIVLLATPPGFRPQHLRACVDAGKHVFAEKPVATDVPGVHHVMATCELAKKKHLAIVSGLCWRYETNMKELIKRLQAGAIGKLVTLESTRFSKGASKQFKPREEGWTDLEYQLRNWYYYTWLGGDFLVEQFVHELDKMSWLMGAYPESVICSGGRSTRTGPNTGHIFDHFNAAYKYENGVRYYASTRQQPGCDSLFHDFAFGSEGVCNLMQYTITGKNPSRDAKRRTDMHQLEHDAMYAALRQGEIPNNGDYMCKSTLMGIMARESAYTGKELTWEQITKSKRRYVPEKLDWNMKLAEPTVAVPGTTPFI